MCKETEYPELVGVRVPEVDSPIYGGFVLFSQGSVALATFCQKSHLLGPNIINISFLERK